MSGPDPERTGIQSADTPSRGAAHSLLETGSDDRISIRTILVPGICFGLGLLYILGGLAWRQLLRTTEFDEEFRIQSTRVIQVPAPRGHIYDRNGKLIVGNRPRYNIVADLGVLRDEIYRKFKSDVNRTKFSRDLKTRREEVAALRRNSRVAVLQTYLNKVNAVLGRNEVVDPKAVEKHISSNLALDFMLVKDIASGEVARFVENFPEKYPLHLYVDSIRSYEHGDSAAHVLGYLRNTDDLGEADESEPEIMELLRLRRDRDRRSDSLFIKYQGKIGKTGLELAYDDELRGKPGSQVWMIQPNGYLYKKISESKAAQGSQIYCSLDIDIQLAAEAALAESRAGPKGQPTGEQLQGAAVAIDVESGEILAMASYPRFDPNEFSHPVPTTRYKQLEESGQLYNLASQGVYPPGSTFKIITAIAGMRSGKLIPDEFLQCGSTFDIGGRSWPEHDGKAFGEVDLVKMIRVSCNVYCYQMGLRIGIQPIADEARRLGLGSKIKLPEVETSNASIVPDPAWNKATGRSGWSSGDTANTSIGQGALRITPLHMAAMIASVAGDRTRTELSLIHDPGKDGLKLSHHAEPLGLTRYQRQRLLDGLRACVQSNEPGSTGKPARVPGLDVVGKTGTAEALDKKKNAVNLAWFEGFAPGNNPKIAVLVMLEGEHGGANIHGGQAAGPVAKAIFAAWLKNHPEAAEGAAPAGTLTFPK